MKSFLQQPWVATLLTLLPIAVIGVFFTGFATAILKDYGIGVFIGVPFYIGIAAPAVHGYKNPKTWKQSLTVAFTTLMLLGIAIIALLIEGIICLIMAAPLAMFFTYLGAFFGHTIQEKIHDKNKYVGSFSALTLMIPLFMVAEDALNVPPGLEAVTTSVEIKATPAEVWKNVVTFSRLPEPQELMFKTGLSYPIEARIEGTGKGAIRYCMFNNGAFVEPIEEWDEPRRLRFSVREQPVPLKELTPYGEITTPHMHDYFVSRQGQFLLTQLPNGNTLLEGTTWYTHKIQPNFYWKWWSDHIVHSIHHRVLSHIKNLSENQKALSEKSQ